jgi:hypothetical protein
MIKDYNVRLFLIVFVGLLLTGAVVWVANAVMTYEPSLDDRYSDRPATRILNGAW